MTKHDKYDYFWTWKGKLEPTPGASIIPTIAEAIEISKEVAANFSFSFNNIKITVCADSQVELIARDFHRAMEGCIEGIIGPMPNENLSDEESAHDKGVRDENARRYAEAVRQCREETAQKEKALEQELAGVTMDITDQPLWDSWLKANTDGYGAAVMRYAERWARLMQLRITEGKTLPTLADECSNGADVEGITGFQYGCAVGMLSKAWRHGEELRCWHNLKTQVGTEGIRANNEGGVLNPALLSIGGQR